MADIKDVAQYFLLLADREAGDSITHLKLQKLCYYAQAWHLADYGDPLFDAEFEAWAHGPANRELYKIYADHKWNSIPVPQSVKEYEPNNFLDLSNKQRGFLADIWCDYGMFDGKYLEQLTHQEDPWINARGDKRVGDYCDAIISKEDMKNFYRNQRQ